MPTHTLSLYEASMGPEAFARLAPAIRRFHTLSGCIELQGEATVEPPQGSLARLLGRLIGTPAQASRGPLHFTLRTRAGAVPSETWTRRFPGRTMASTLSLAGRLIQEHLGAARLLFVLEEQDGALSMRLLSLHFFGVPCPRWLMPEVVARETGQGSHIRFDVSARVPGLGQVARYRGHLDLDTARPLEAA